MNKELNNSKIDKFTNSVKCGFCNMKWGMERFDTQYFTCKKCGTDMVEFDPDYMPIRKLSILFNKKNDSN